MPHDSLAPWCSLPLAILTSGQQDRFTYETAFAFVRAKSGRTSLQTLLTDRTNHCAPSRVDAFIVLSVGNASTWTRDGAFTGYTSSHEDRASSRSSSSSSTTPYHAAGGQQMISFDTAKVEEFYRRQGAGRVRLILVSAAQLSNATRRIESEVARRGARAIASSSRQWWGTAQTSIPRWNVRWSPHSRMLYLRHVAYQAALSTGQPYGQCVQPIITLSLHAHT